MVTFTTRKTAQHLQTAPGQVPHTPAHVGDTTGCAAPSRIEVLPNRARHTACDKRGPGAAFHGQGPSRHLPSVPKLNGKFRPAQDAALGLPIRWQEPRPEPCPCGAQDTSPAPGDSGDISIARVWWEMHRHRDVFLLGSLSMCYTNMVKIRRRLQFTREAGKEYLVRRVFLIGLCTSCFMPLLTDLMVHHLSSPLALNLVK